jgi:hypothetical protein
VFQALDSDRPSIQEHACYILENFCESLQPKTLRPYLEALLNRLINLLQIGKPNIKEMALSALASAAVASEMEFIPYLRVRNFHCLIISASNSLFYYYLFIIANL